MSQPQPREDSFFAKRAKPSATLALDAIASTIGADGLGAGQLGNKQSDEVINVGKASIRSELMKYTPASGFASVRQAVAFMYHQEFGIEYDWAKQVSLRAGGKANLTNLFDTILPAGANKVLIGEDQWLSYREMLKNKGILINVPTPVENNNKMPGDVLSKIVTEQDPRLIIYADPGNPTGASHNAEELKIQAEILRSNPNTILGTEIMYRKIKFGTAFDHILKHAPDLEKNVILLDCWSKFAVGHNPGGRAGMLAGPADIVGAMNGNVSHDLGNPPVPGQLMGLAAIMGERLAMIAIKLEIAKKGAQFERFLQTNQALEEYQRMEEQHQSIVPDLEARMLRGVEIMGEAGINVSPADGAFYLYPDISNAIGKTVPKDMPLYKNADPAILAELNDQQGTDYKPMGGQKIKDDKDYVAFQLLHMGVGTVAGSEFRKPEDDSVVTSLRMSFAASDDVFDPAVTRFANGHKLLLEGPG